MASARRWVDRADPIADPRRGIAAQLRDVPAHSLKDQKGAQTHPIFLFCESKDLTTRLQYLSSRIRTAPTRVRHAPRALPARKPPNPGGEASKAVETRGLGSFIRGSPPSVESVHIRKTTVPPLARATVESWDVAPAIASDPGETPVRDPDYTQPPGPRALPSPANSLRRLTLGQGNR